MHSPQRPLLRTEGNVALHQTRIQPMSFEFLLAPGPSEESAIIQDRFEMNLEDTLYRGFVELHEETGSLRRLCLC